MLKKINKVVIKSINSFLNVNLPRPSPLCIAGFPTTIHASTNLIASSSQSTETLTCTVRSSLAKGCGGGTVETATQTSLPLHFAEVTEVNKRYS